MTRRFAFACALAAVAAGGCRQTLVLDDLGPDAGRPGTGGTSGSGGAIGTGGRQMDASTDARCFGQLLPFNADVPQVIVALDRSSDMGASFGTSDQLHAALSAIQAEVSKYGGGHNSHVAIQFSFLDFPDTASDCDASSGCCPSDVTMSYSDFQDASTCNGPGPNSCLQSMNHPTAAALQKAYDQYDFGNAQHGNERYVLLITDSDPQGPCPNNNAACSDAIQAVGDLTNIGVTTEVVAIGSGAACLPELATAQGISPPPYTVASQPTDLPTAIDQIAGTIAQSSNCRLTLAQLPSSGQIVLTFGGNVQSENGSSNGAGWSYGSDDTRIILHGSLCQSYVNWLTSPFGSGLQIYDGCVPDHPGQTP